MLLKKSLMLSFVFFLVISFVSASTCPSESNFSKQTITCLQSYFYNPEEDDTLLAKLKDLLVFYFSNVDVGDVDDCHVLGGSSNTYYIDEILQGCSIDKSKDKDNDGMPDDWEDIYKICGLNPDYDDALLDADEDLLENLGEYQNNTNPCELDSDGDGHTDYNEVLTGSDPTNSSDIPDDYDDDGMPDFWENLYGFNFNNASDASQDFDGDGMTNLQEYQIGTNPKENSSPADTDKDGMPDVWEILYGFNPNDPSDASLDPDGDGYTNLQEYQNGTHPRIFDPPKACTESWTCTTWTTCTAGQQTRTCTDANNCGTTNTKPATMQTCGSIKADITPDMISAGPKRETHNLYLNNLTCTDTQLDSFCFVTDVTGDYLQIDLGTGNTKDFVKMRWYGMSSKYTAGLEIRWSDDASSWNLAKTSSLQPGESGFWQDFSWLSAGPHRYWRVNTLSGVSVHCYEIEWYFIAPLAEQCNLAGDEDNNGECDYDSTTCSHGDVNCPVEVTVLAISNENPTPGSNIKVQCTTTSRVNSINLTVEGVGECEWLSWNENTAQFSCNVGSATGTKTIRCSVDTAKSYKTGTDKVGTINVQQAQTCPDKPDLTVTDIELTPTNPQVGQNMNRVSKVKNLGGVASPVVNIKCYVDDVQTCYGSFGPLDPGATVANYSHNVGWGGSWTAVVGTHKFEWVIDADNHAAECNETNNRFVKYITVTGNCSDGTLYGQCSTTKPKYCENGNLINKCNPCGCSSGTCQADGQCGACTENWTCDWTACYETGEYGGIWEQPRTCTDTNKCGTTVNKPPEETRTCPTCEWSCTAWGTSCQATSDTKSTGYGAYYRTCTKVYPYCVGSSPSTSQSCVCWSCGSWSICASNTQTRTCTKQSSCVAGDSYKPAETRNCPFCTDSDGLNYEYQGIVTADTGTFTDYCKDSNNMAEYSCIGTAKNEAQIDCSSLSEGCGKVSQGCSGGQCWFSDYCP